MDTHNFISRHDLAVAYAPDLTPHAALKRFNKWINGNRTLLRALKRSGYSDNQRKFLPRHISLIHKYLGEP